MSWRKRLEAQGGQALRFQGSPHHVNHAFWPSIDHLERKLKFERDDAPESKLDASSGGRSSSVNTACRWSDLRFVASTLSILPCEACYGPLARTPPKHKDETLRALVDVIGAAARDRPSVVLFEDVHWADATTLEVLDQLVERVKDMLLLIVLTHRPEFKNRWASRDYVLGYRHHQAHMCVQMRHDGIAARWIQSVAQRSG